MVRSTFSSITFSILLLPFICLADQVLTTIPEIRALIPDEVEGEIPVEVVAQILCQRKITYGTFLYDGDSGIYMSHWQFPEIVDQLRVGDWIRVKGIVEPGGFSPAIYGRHIEIIDHKPLPESMPYDMDDRNLATMDCQWVLVQGRLVSVSISPNQLDMMAVVERAGKNYHIQSLYSDEGWKRLNSMMFRDVQLNAIAATLFNLRKQATGRTFIVDSMSDIVLINSDLETADAPLVPISHLMRKDSDSYDIVRTGGIITGASGKELFLRDDVSGLRVQSARPVEVAPGDFVEVTGYVWPQPVSPAFRALKVRRVRAEEPPEPRLVELGVSVDEALNYDLIRLTAKLVDIGKNFRESDSKQQTLLCRSGAHLFEARMPVDIELEQSISVGAELQLTGNIHIIQNQHFPGMLQIAGFWIQLRGSNDVQIIRPAPWWTPKRLNWAFGGLAGALVLILGWVFMLRQTVDRQTKVIGDQIERETILNERQRMARELHDNVEQGLGGIAIQLRNCRKQNELISEKLNATGFADRVAGIDEELKGTDRAIVVAQNMLEYCSKESRAAILDLRGVALERKEFRALLKEALEHLAEECDAQLEMKVSGEPMQLSRMVERHLLLIAKEAGSNAARHAAPSCLKVALRYLENRVSLTVSDDGCGFDSLNPDDTGHFGLKGMQERANKLNGSIQIKSAPSEGTEVNVEVPVSQNNTGTRNQ